MEPSPSISLFARAGAKVLGTPLPAPYATPSMRANLILRVTLSLVANVVSVVPLRVLHRNGEFAATVFIANTMLVNVETVVSSLLWRDDNIAQWWRGWGYCDFMVHFHNASSALFISCLLAIMRNLAQQVGLMRASPLTDSERTRRNLVQALIMFPLPIIHVAWTTGAALRRYEVGTLIGCSWIPHPSWPNLTFFVAPPALIALATSAYALLTYIRFRQIAKMTESALSSNQRVSRRSQRTKRRLYMMVMSILVPYLPVIITMAVANVLAKPAWEAWDPESLRHDDGSPMPWSTVALVPSTEIDWASTNLCYINILTAVPIFLFFGTTKDAVNEYRAAALVLGLGRLFPRFRTEYDPDRTPRPGSPFGSSRTGGCADSPASMAKTNPSGSSRNLDSMRSGDPDAQTIHFAPSGADPEHGQIHPQPPAPLSAEDRACNVPAAGLAHGRNPFFFRSRLNFPVSLRLPLFARRTDAQPEPQPEPAPTVALRPLRTVSSLPQWNDPVASAPRDPDPIWPAGEARLFRVDTSAANNDGIMPRLDGPG